RLFWTAKHPLSDSAFGTATIASGCGRYCSSIHSPYPQHGCSSRGAIQSELRWLAFEPRANSQTKRRLIFRETIIKKTPERAHSTAGALPWRSQAPQGLRLGDFDNARDLIARGAAAGHRTRDHFAGIAMLTPTEA